MSETIGNLFDKLTIVNLKIWRQEDIKRSSNDDHEIAEATRKTNVLNQQRNDLVQEIDELINGLINGTKKMKTYKSKADKQIHDDLRGELRRNMQELREISNRRDYTEPDELPEENKKVGILYGRIGEIYEEMA